MGNSVLGNQMDITVPSVAIAGTVSGFENKRMFVSELDTQFKYKVNSSKTVNGTSVLATGAGGTTRWIAISGKYCSSGLNVTNATGVEKANIDSETGEIKGTTVVTTSNDAGTPQLTSSATTSRICTTSSTLLANDTFIIANPQSVAITLTLPPITSAILKRHTPIVIKNITTYNVTIIGNIEAETIDGITNPLGIVLSTQYEAISLIAVDNGGYKWYIV